MQVASLAYAAETTLGLQATPNNYSYNATGYQEKYLVSNNGHNSGAGSGLYIIMPNGNLYAWTGAITSTLAALPVYTLSSAYYQNPGFLLNTAAPGGVQYVSSTTTSENASQVTASISGNTLTVTDVNNNGYYIGTVLVFVTISDGALTTTQTFQVTFT